MIIKRESVIQYNPQIFSRHRRTILLLPTVRWSRGGIGWNWEWTNSSSVLSYPTPPFPPPSLDRVNRFSFGACYGHFSSLRSKCLRRVFCTKAAKEEFFDSALWLREDLIGTSKKYILSLQVSNRKSHWNASSARQGCDYPSCVSWWSPTRRLTVFFVLQKSHNPFITVLEDVITRVIDKR